MSAIEHNIFTPRELREIEARVQKMRDIAASEVTKAPEREKEIIKICERQITIYMAERITARRAQIYRYGLVGGFVMLGLGFTAKFLLPQGLLRTFAGLGFLSGIAILWGLYYQKGNGHFAPVEVRPEPEIRLDSACTCQH